MKYFVMAALLGAGWFAVMLIPSWTRPWLLEERALIVFNLVELMAASVIVAAIFRGAVDAPIASGDGSWSPRWFRWRAA